MTSDSNHPFFRPLWRRIAIVAVVLAWSVVEWVNGQTMWGVMTLLIGVYGVWVFFVKYDPGPVPGPISVSGPRLGPVPDEERGDRAPPL